MCFKQAVANSTTLLQKLLRQANDKETEGSQ